MKAERMKPEERPTAAELAYGDQSSTAGLECPHCGCRDFRVRNTRAGDNVIKRYRVCRHCGYVRRTSES
jgi:DNA-directed RNA polymerase subunit M/transcription elongation factor TFIIS